MFLGSLEPDTLMLGGSQVDKVMLGTEEVWTNEFPIPSPIVITVDGTYIAGTDFPAGVPISLALIGGGGGGAGSNSTFDGGCGGGFSGAITEDSFTYTEDDVVTATIGTGGASISTNNNGLSGGATSFGTHTAVGGGGGFTYWDASRTDFNGNGAEVTNVFGTFNDGLSDPIGWGGQAGAGNGGNSNIYDPTTPATSGGIGSGGGACFIAGDSGPTGAGGNGQIILSW